MRPINKRLVADYLVYLVVRAIVCVLQCLPIESAYALGRAIAALAYSVDRRHRRIALENLKHAYGESMTERERRRLVFGVYRHFCQMIVEIAFIPRKLHVYNWKKYVAIDVRPESIDQFVQGGPALVVTGHFGNWEMAGYLLAVIGLKTSAIARDLDNPFLHDFVQRFRSWSGQRILSKNGDYDKIQQTLASGELLISVGDQSAGPKGMFVDFFGRPASTHKAVALLAREYEAPIIVGYAIRDRDAFHYKICCSPPMDVIAISDSGGMRAVTQAFTKQLEDGIRLAPEQYLWLHNRWKHQPPVKSKGKAIRQAA